MILYKYAGSSGLRILEGLTLKVSPPDQFNDPFEITPRSKFTYTLSYFLKRLKSDPQSFRSVYDLLVEHEHLQISFEQFLSDMPREIRNRFPKTAKLLRRALSESDMNSLSNASKQLGVLCLAKNKASICMWGHYANDHKGMALGLDFSARSPNVCVTHRRVRYRKDRCRINRLHKPGSSEWTREATNLLFTKSNVWKYEREYRYVIPLNELSWDKTNGIHVLHIDSEMIAEVIFGCSAPRTDIESVRSLIKRRPRTYGHIKLFRCERHRSQFKLNIVPC